MKDLGIYFLCKTIHDFLPDVYFLYWCFAYWKIYRSGDNLSPFLWEVEFEGKLWTWSPPDFPSVILRSFQKDCTGPLGLSF